MVDFSNGRPASEDYGLLAAPDIAAFGESNCLVGYSIDNDIGLFFHTGARPGRYHLWLERVIISLPGGEDFVIASAEGQNHQPLKPGASNLSFECIEPFRRWRLRYDAGAQITTRAQKVAGAVTYARRRLLKVDITAEAVMPVWALGGDKEEHKAQESDQRSRGFHMHHEQMMTISGTVEYDGTAYPISGFAWRDHSRGPRSYARFGRNSLMGAWFSSGRGFGMLQGFDVDGNQLVSDAYVVENGVLEKAAVIDVTPFTDLSLIRPEVVLRLRRSNGQVLQATGQLMAQAIQTMCPETDQVIGALWDNPENRIHTTGQTRWEWDGEIGWGTCERSNAAKDLKYKYGYN
jgi:hypothetical protein